MTNILMLNEISEAADKVFAGKYKASKDCKDPAGIILRSFSMHEYNIPESVYCVARAGAGVNNIPVEKYAASGVVVFNTPGANANAVKELVIASLLLASRKIIPAISWAATLKPKGAEVAKLVEKGKGDFVGPEILGKTLGVIGLGAIGQLVANSCIKLGMNVIGYDPYISVDAAWNLDHSVKKETDLNALMAASDYITLHVPYMAATKEMINAAALEKMKNGACVINCSRAELVNNADILAAIKSGKISRYVTDFPTEELLDVENVVAIPHLGASTPEAEDNCAFMAAKQMADFLENGNIRNSVNFSECVLNRSGKTRVTVIHKNISSMISKMSDIFGQQNINIGNMLSTSKGDFAYTMFDIDDVSNKTIESKLSALEGVIRVRVIV